MSDDAGFVGDLIDYSEYWWSRITGPKLVIGKVTDELIHKKIVFLEVPSDIPWRHAMRDEIAKRYQRKVDADCFVEQIDVVDEGFNCAAIGRTLLSKYGTDSYRSGMGISVQDYIIKNGILKNHILWIKGLDKEKVGKWIEFCEGYRIRDHSDGLFVIEYNEGVTIPKHKFFSHISYEKYVTPSDLRSFISILLNSEKRDLYSEYWRSYITELCTSVCDTDAELSCNLILSNNLQQSNLFDALRRLADGQFTRRGEDVDSKHILNYIRKGDTSTLDWRIWRAQLRILFPIIEMIRVDFIQKHQIELQEALFRNKVMQFGVQIIDPENLEYGTLDYMMNHRGQSDDNYLFSISDKAEREKIEFYHQIRNKMAHGVVCNTEELQSLMNYIELEHISK